MNKYLFTPKKNFLSIKTMIEIIKGMVRFKLNIYGVSDYHWYIKIKIQE